MKLTKNNNEYSFVLELYRTLFEAFSDFEDEEKYHVYRNMLVEVSERLSHDERTFHYSRLINYCIMKKNGDSTRKKYAIELFNIYIKMLENNYYKDDKVDILSVDLFRDILLQALELKKYKWVENFIKNYCDKVLPQYAGNMYNLAYAYINFSQKNYNQVIDFLNKINVNEFVFKFDIRNLLIKSYYELGYTEEILYQIHSYREFLRKNELVAELRRSRIENYLRFLKKLVLMKDKESAINIGYVKQQLLKAENVAYKDWLLEKFGIMEYSARK